MVFGSEDSVRVSCTGVDFYKFKLTQSLKRGEGQISYLLTRCSRKRERQEFIKSFKDDNTQTSKWNHTIISHS